MRSADSVTKTPIHVPHARWTFVEYFSLAAFILWSAVGFIFTVKHISPTDISHWPISLQLQQFVDFCKENGDPFLILLAFINTHLQAARQWSAGVARRWAALVVVLSFGIETYGQMTGLPFGQYKYTDNFGPMLGTVPLVIPFAWHVVVTNALFLVRSPAPHLSRFVEAALAGVICTIYDAILEPFATTVKHYWAWTEGSVPPLNYVAWFAISTLLVLIFAPTLSSRHRIDPRPALIMGCTILIFIAGAA